MKISDIASRWISACAAVVMAVATLLVSCTVDVDSDGISDMPEVATVYYDGIWEINGSQGSRALFGIQSDGNSFRNLCVPYDDILKVLYPEAAISGVQGSYADTSFRFTAASADGTALYSFLPFVWHFSATVDGQHHSFALGFPSSGDAGDTMSWGTYTKTGALSVILYATSLSVDGGEAKSVHLRLASTAKRVGASANLYDK